MLRAQQLLRIELALADPLPSPHTRAERAYLAGICALSVGDPASAAEHLRATVEADEKSCYGTADLLRVIAAAQLGDGESVAQQVLRCITAAGADDFARETITDARLDLYVRARDPRAALTVRHCIEQPAAAALVTLAASALVAGRRDEAAQTLEQVHDAVEMSREWHKSGFSNHLPEISGLSTTITGLLIDSGHLQQALDYIEAHPWRGDALWRGRILAQLGDRDRAVTVLTEFLRETDDDVLDADLDMTMRCMARYQKARMLIERGDLKNARREVRRVFSEDPDFEDYDGLRRQVGLDG